MQFPWRKGLFFSSAGNTGSFSKRLIVVQRKTVIPEEKRHTVSFSSMMPRLEEKSGQALCASAKHASNITAVCLSPMKDSASLPLREVCELMEHLAEITIRRAARGTHPPTFQILRAGFLGSLPVAPWAAF
jgi:hypothetical protein